MKYAEMTGDRLREERAALQKEYSALQAKGLHLDISRGKPSFDQLSVSEGLLATVHSTDDCQSLAGFDCRNYGIADGLPEMKALFSELTGIPAGNIVVGGNSSLNMIYDTLSRIMLFGTCDSPRPWCREESIAFLCPVPGYDRHFRISETFGIRMIDVPMNADGPDMDVVEKIVKSDPTVRGMWNVPKYSNPSGVTYSDTVVRRLASMECAAPDFRIFWDNAYMVHDLYDEGDRLLDLFGACAAAGNPNRVLYFTSTSKITFPGDGVAMMAMSDENLRHDAPMLNAQSIGPDKINQLRHVRFLKNADGVREQMKRHATYLRPRFECLLDVMEKELAPLGIASWTRPRGGYFVSLDVPDGCAKRVYALAKDAGVTLTGAGATFPYGRDARDRNLRLAPSFARTEEIRPAAEILCTCVRLAAVEKLLEK